MSAPDTKGVSEILVITLSNIGDAILTTPVISVLRERFQSARLSVVAGPKTLALFQNSRLVNRVIQFDKHVPLKEKIRFIRTLRRTRFDIVVDLRDTLIPWLLRARYRSRLGGASKNKAMRKRHLEKLRFLKPSIRYDQENTFDFFSPEDEKTAAGKLHGKTSGGKGKTIVIVAPGAGSELKRWTRSGFRAVIQHHIKKGRTVVMLGSADEQKLGEELKRISPEALVNLVGKLTLRESAALVAKASIVVANDSAVMHLAHEMSVPAVSIFGPTSEIKYGRKGDRFRCVRLRLPCTPCEKAKCQISYRACLDDLQPKQVIEACEELLDGANV